MLEMAVDTPALQQRIYALLAPLIRSIQFTDASTAILENVAMTHLAAMDHSGQTTENWIDLKNPIAHQ